MKNTATLDTIDWLWASYAAIKSLRGRISKNVRMIKLGHDGTDWFLHAILEYESKDDEDELEDAADEMLAHLLDAGEDIGDLAQSSSSQAITLVDKSNIDKAWSASEWVLYRRKE